jgi:hypothetical protein
MDYEIDGRLQKRTRGKEKTKKRTNFKYINADEYNLSDVNIILKNGMEFGLSIHMVL